jgi:hypothetical protein
MPRETESLVALLKNEIVGWLAFHTDFPDYGLQCIVGTWPDTKHQKLRYQWQPLFKDTQ